MNTFTTDLLRTKKRNHIDHVVELQIVAAALNRIPTTLYTRANWLEELVDFFNDHHNLQVLNAADNRRKRDAITRLIAGRATKAGDADWRRAVRRKWRSLRQAPKFRQICSGDEYRFGDFIKVMARSLRSKATEAGATEAGVSCVMCMWCVCVQDFTVALRLAYRKYNYEASAMNIRHSPELGSEQRESEYRILVSPRPLCRWPQRLTPDRDAPQVCTLSAYCLALVNHWTTNKRPLTSTLRDGMLAARCCPRSATPVIGVSPSPTLAIASSPSHVTEPQSSCYRD
jgi:hypothetical protein